MPTYYYIEFLGDAEAAVAALPSAAVPAYNSVLGMLVRDPWKGDAVYTSASTDPVRFAALNTSVGGGFLYYFIAEDEKIVRIYKVSWVDQD